MRKAINKLLKTEDIKDFVRRAEDTQAICYFCEIITDRSRPYEHGCDSGFMCKSCYDIRNMAVNTKLTRGQLLDLLSSNGDGGAIDIIDQCYKTGFNDRYVIIWATNSSEFAVHDYNRRVDIISHIESFYRDPDGSSWHIHSIWDLENRVKIAYKITITVDLIEEFPTSEKINVNKQCPKCGLSAMCYCDLTPQK